MPGDTRIHHLPGFYEPFSAISHIVAVMIFVYLGAKLLRRGHAHRASMAFLIVYSAACVFLFSMSTLFHMVERGGTAGKVMERLDHGAIFLLIAGTFTAVHGIMFHGWFRWIPLLVVWLVAAICITLKTVFFESLPEWLGLSLYLGLGWSVALTAIPIMRRHGFRYLTLVLYGGLAYSLGALMEFKGWFVIVPGVVHAHELWHIAVLAGALFHWRFVWKIAGDDRLVETAEEARHKKNGLPP